MKGYDVREVMEDPGLNGDNREGDVHIAVRECHKALEKFTALIAVLEDRLNVVRRLSDRAPIDHRAGETEAEHARSPLARDLHGYAEGIGLLGRRVSILLEELEI
jgi:hypothetical protein